MFLLVMQGYASQYAPGVMERVVNVRQRNGSLPDDLPNVDGYAAVPDCSNIGDTFLARPEGEDEWEKFLAVDCGCPQGYRFLMSLLPWDASETQRRFAAIEVDYMTAVRWNTVGRGVEIEVAIPLDVRKDLE